MPRSTKTVVTVDCDVCATEISDDMYVGAMTYGVAAHIDCWDHQNGPVIARLLGLDDIRIRWTQTDEEVPSTRYGKVA